MNCNVVLKENFPYNLALKFEHFRSVSERLIQIRSQPSSPLNNPTILYISFHETDYRFLYDGSIKKNLKYFSALPESLLLFLSGGFHKKSAQINILIFL